MKGMIRLVDLLIKKEKGRAPDYVQYKGAWVKLVEASVTA